MVLAMELFLGLALRQAQRLETKQVLELRLVLKQVLEQLLRLELMLLISTPMLKHLLRHVLKQALKVMKQTLKLALKQELKLTLRHRLFWCNMPKLRGLCLVVKMRRWDGILREIRLFLQLFKFFILWVICT